jgi:ATP-dependent exoDNAse (exonuclease V) beta subunit
LLVERYLEILRAKVSVDNIVAITFQSAPAKMRQRVRDRIDGLLRESSRPRQTWLRHSARSGARSSPRFTDSVRVCCTSLVEANIDPQFCCWTSIRPRCF